MAIVEQVADAVQQTLTSLAGQVGEACGIIQRKREFSEESLAQTMAFGFLRNPNPNDEELAQMACLCGAKVTPQAVAQRFTWALAWFLKSLLEACAQRVVAEQPAAVPLLQKFNGVYVQDSSTISLPAEMAEQFPSCGGDASPASVKVQTRLELTTGALDYVGLEAGNRPDQGAAMQQAPLPKGSLRIADLGYFGTAILAQLTAQAVFWISRLPASTVVFTAEGERLDLRGWLADHVRCGVKELSVQLGVKQRLPARLVAYRVPQEVASRRRQKLKAEYQRKGRPLTKERLAWCDWTVYVTNVEAEILTPKEIQVLYRARWQIELLFKLWKSEGWVAATTSSQPVRQAGEIFARLLAVTVQHWLLVASVWKQVDRSLTKAVRQLRGFVVNLALAIKDSGLLAQQIETIGDSLTKTARANRRKRKPSTFQLLMNPDLLEYS